MTRLFTKPADLIADYEETRLEGVYAAAEYDALPVDQRTPEMLARVDALTDREADLANAIVRNPARDKADIEAKLTIVRDHGLTVLERHGIPTLAGDAIRSLTRSLQTFQIQAA